MATLTDLIAAQLGRPEFGTGVPAQARQTWQAFEHLFLQIGGALVRVAQSPPSPGYEPWFVERGGGRLGARGLARLLVHAGKRRARDNQWRGEVVKALRHLAKPLQTKSAVMRRVRMLLEAWQESSVIETIFHNAGQDEFEFIRLLKTARAGNTSVFNRLAEIAGTLRRGLVVPRGPKMGAASEAHTLFLELARPTGASRSSYTWDPIEGDFTDPQTRATRLEFNDRKFSPKRACQHLKPAKTT